IVGARGAKAGRFSPSSVPKNARCGGHWPRTRPLKRHPKALRRRKSSRRDVVAESEPPPLPGYPPIVDPLAPLVRTAAVGGPPPLPPSIEDIPIRELAPPEPE